SRRDVIACGLTALARLAHRGAPPSLGAVDGCGLLTSIPWPLLEGQAPTRFEGRTRALGMFFVERGRTEAAIRVIDRVLRDAGAAAVWRPAKTDAAAVPPRQRATTPAVFQALLPLDVSAPLAASAPYRARLLIDSP